MSSVIDVKQLTDKEIEQLLIDLIDNGKVTLQQFTSLAVKKGINTIEEEESMSHIKGLIDQHFEEYDEVFRKLA